MGQRGIAMKNRRHTPEQVARKLREADRLLGEGFELGDVLKELEVSGATYHRWRAQYGGMKAADVKRLKELESENATLKRIVADQLLNIEGLKELSKGNL
jgi:putative transposase